MVGYAFGASIIVSTHDGGNTWVTETPSGLVTSTAATDAVTGIATGAGTALRVCKRSCEDFLRTPRRFKCHQMDTSGKCCCVADFITMVSSLRSADDLLGSSS